MVVLVGCPHSENSGPLDPGRRREAEVQRDVCCLMTHFVRFLCGSRIFQSKLLTQLNPA